MGAVLVVRHIQFADDLDPLTVVINSAVDNNFGVVVVAVCVVL